MTAEEFEARIYAAADLTQKHELRSDMVMGMYYMARANLHALLAVTDNTDPGDPIHIMACDQLEAIHGLLSEKLNKFN